MCFITAKLADLTPLLYLSVSAAICGYTHSANTLPCVLPVQQYVSQPYTFVFAALQCIDTNISLLANEGINIQEIARRLDHTDVNMTWNTYSHLYHKEEDRSVDILNKIV